MAKSFNETFLAGFEQYSDYFDDWCEKASTALGNVTQCGIIELDSSGHAFFAGNRVDFGEYYLAHKGYLLDPRFTFSSNKPIGFEVFSSNEGLLFLAANEKPLFDKEFDLWHGFSCAVRVDSDTIRYYFFASDSLEIYNELINNQLLVKKFIEIFKKDSEGVVNHFKNRKFNIAEHKDDYFVDSKIELTPREKLMSLLHSFNVLDRNINITKREWQCFELYCQGKSAGRTGEVFGISRRTVETHFVKLKEKLNVGSKQELIEVLGSSPMRKVC